MSEVLVIDIGGSKTQVCLVSGDTFSKINILESKIFPTDSNPEHMIQHILSFCENKKINDISLSLPGKWKEGKLIESNFLKDWLNYPFISNLSKILNVQNIIWETDVICGGLGEYYSLVETHSNASLLYMNLGTGIGASFIQDGKPFKSNSKLTLRMQKLFFPHGDVLYPACDLISGGTLTSFADFNSIEQLFSAYKKGNIEAIDLISKAQTQLSCHLINLFYLFAPDVIILNGGLTYDWDVLAEEAVDIAKEELQDEVEILPGKLKEMAPIYGAFVNLKAGLINPAFKNPIFIPK